MMTGMDKIWAWLVEYDCGLDRDEWASTGYGPIQLYLSTIGDNDEYQLQVFIDPYHLTVEVEIGPDDEGFYASHYEVYSTAEELLEVYGSCNMDYMYDIGYEAYLRFVESGRLKEVEAC